MELISKIILSYYAQVIQNFKINRTQQMEQNKDLHRWRREDNSANQRQDLASKLPPWLCSSLTDPIYEYTASEKWFGLIPAALLRT
jgi:hypothetical protein